MCGASGRPTPFGQTNLGQAYGMPQQQPRSGFGTFTNRDLGGSNVANGPRGYNNWNSISSGWGVPQQNTRGVWGTANDPRLAAQQPAQPSFMRNFHQSQQQQPQQQPAQPSFMRQFQDQQAGTNIQQDTPVGAIPPQQDTPVGAVPPPATSAVMPEAPVRSSVMPEPTRAETKNNPISRIQPVTSPTPTRATAVQPVANPQATSQALRNPQQQWTGGVGVPAAARRRRWGRR